MKIGIDMNNKAIILAIFVIAVAACNRDKSETLTPEGELITIRATMEGAAGTGDARQGDPRTRTTLVDAGTTVFWEPADEIKVFFNGNSGRFISQNTGNTSVANFSGTLNVVVGAPEGVVSSNLTWGLYPYRSDAVSDGVSVTTTLPAVQTGRAGSFARNTHITLARSENYELSFYNVCGGLRFSLTQEGIKRITFEGNDGEPLAGRIKLSFEDSIPAVKEISDTNKVITLTAPGGDTFQTGQWYYLEAIPGLLSKGYTMVFHKASESAKLTSASAVTFRRGVIGQLSNADENIIFKPSGSSEPDPDDAIQFEDLAAMYACLEKFDSNGDGEVSYAEAAAAKSLANLFRDWNTVKSFEEIRYFTSVTSTQDVFTGLTQLRHITIPDHITTLGTFKNCSALDTVVLPAALSSIPANCFDGCSSLRSVTLPTGLKDIPNYAFQKCAKLTSLAVPPTLTSVAQYAFSGCSSLVGVDLPSGLKTIGNYAFQNCSAMKAIVLPSSLTALGTYVFSNCTALSTVVLPKDMTSLPAYCFQNCSKLATITWPNALTTISNNAFEGCRFADSEYALQLPSSVTTIGSKAFGALCHLIIPSTSPVAIASNSFKNGYTVLYVPAGMVDMYKVRTNWSIYADRIMPIGDYPVSFSVGGTVGEPVDLGLSVKWASWNVGASAPEENGAYFAWGEIDTKENYSWSTYQLCNGSSSTLTLYNTKSNYGTVDNITTLELVDDAARANWGGTWRMPTDAEWTELRNNCTWTWTTQNGVNGRLVTSTNGNSIFLPAAGYRDDTNLDDVGSNGNYWSSSLNTGSPYYAWYVYFSSSYVGRSNGSRCNGLSVRPVSE